MSADASTIVVTDRLFPSPRSFPRTDLVGLARRALLDEAALSPKPGLVDRRGNGAHSDLSFPLMSRSAIAIEPWFGKMCAVARGAQPNHRLRMQLGVVGRNAERAMFRATGGVNAHRGAIWVLGLLIAGAAMDPRDRFTAHAIARRAADLARLDDPSAPRTVSHGSIATRRFGVSGARGEAIAGFPQVVQCALPMLRSRRRAGAPENVARLDALLAIMARLSDTCLLHRGGCAALGAAQEGAAEVMEAGGSGTSRGWQRLGRLDRRLLAMNASPGGSADLLAATLFLDAVEHTCAASQTPQLNPGAAYGTS